jgi:group I intron endonuclease
MTFGYIYKIVFPNGKHYIGLTTTSLEQRQKQHRTRAKSGDTKCLYNALRKYGMEDTFELIEIDTADTIEELCEKEKKCIIEYNSYYMNRNGYNMTHGGEGTTGYVHTEEQREEQSKISKLQWENPEARQKMSEIIKKHFENPEARQQCSEAQKKRYENPEEIQKNRESQIKRFENPEARQKNSESQKKRYENPEQRKAHSERMKTLFENPDAIKKCSEAQKKRFENPEERQKMSEMKKKQFEDNPEIQTKRLDAMGKNKPFDVFKDGEFIKTFTYQFQAKEYLQKEHEITSNVKISDVLAGRQKNSAGFVFKYK